LDADLYLGLVQGYIYIRRSISSSSGVWSHLCPP
jgi:hypothetical protein